MAVPPPDSEQAAYIAGLLRMYGHDDLADEFARRVRGEAKPWTKLRVGDTFMCEITVRKGTPAPFVFDEDAE